MAKIAVKGREIAVVRRNDEDYIRITDIARYKNSEHTDDLIRNWLRNRNTIEFLGLWEQLNNPGFKPIEFDGFKIAWWTAQESRGLGRVKRDGQN